MHLPNHTSPASHVLRTGVRGALVWLALHAPIAASADSVQGQAPPVDAPYLLMLGDNTILSPILSYDFMKASVYDTRGSFTGAERGHVNRIGFDLQKPGVYDINVYYSMLANRWRNAYLKLESAAFLPGEFGSLRLGEGKIPLDFERNTSSTQSYMIENSSASQAIFENCRLGAQWSLSHAHWLVDAGYYGDNLEGSNPGHTWALHAAWVPINTPGDVLHLGVARSVEYPEGRDDADGQALPVASFKVSPDPLLDGDNDVNSGTLDGARRIARAGLEGFWIDGPVSLQGEYLSARTTFDIPGKSYDIDGHYLLGSWILTGESRRYAGGYMQNPHPARPYGAVELVLRYSTVNLNDRGIYGGSEHDWTAGLNWYLGSRWRLQWNYTRASAFRRELWMTPRTFEFRLEFFI